MRIALDYRMISGGANVVNRGTGRYTQQQLRAVLNQDTENEYLLICHTQADETLILPEIRQAPNVSLHQLALPGVKSTEHPNQPDRALRQIAQFQDWLYQLKVDLYHETTPYQVDELVLSHFDVCPLVATVYDLIPAVYPQYYWPPGKPYHEELERALHLMTRAQRLIAISESSRRDAHLYLGVPPARIDLAYPLADPLFRRLPAAEVEQALHGLRSRLVLPASFVMCLSHLHHSKNLNTLMLAYAALPPAVRKRTPLVAVFYLGEGDKEFIYERATAYGIQDDILLTGLVSDAELVALYNAATLVVHPSRYEGFGYPVVEAMQCGTPVITTTASSLPEVGGDAAVLVDPDDVQGFTDAMLELLGNPSRCDAMRASGLEQIKRFNAEQLAQNTLDAYRATLADAEPAAAPTQPRVAVWTSLPPLKCGIADYTTEVLPQLAQTHQIELFVDDGYLPSSDLMRRYTIHHHSAITRRMAQQPFDLQLYQFGISLMHDFMYPSLQQRPGVVVMHDLNFAADLYYVYDQRGRLDAFEREVVAPEGPEALRAFQHIQQLSGPEQEQARQAFLRTYPLNQWIVSNSLAQVVHIAEAKRELEARCPDARAFTFPMGVAEPWSDLTQRLQPVRDDLLEDPDTFLVGVFGSVAPIKRLEACLQAFQRLLEDQPNSQLAIVGEVMSPAYGQQLQALVESLGIAENVQVVGRTTRAEFHRWLLACDVVLNLRYPPKLQMSAVLCRAIAAGKPVIISDLPEWRFLPETFCWRVAPEADEILRIADYLSRLATDPELRLERSQQARAYYEQTSTVPQLAEAYREVFAAVTAQPPVPLTDCPTQPTAPLPLNKPCELEDFSNPELAAVIRDVFEHESRYFPATFPHGAERREYWESAMSVLALRRYQHLHSDAQVLTLNAGAHPLNYYLTRQVRQVFATDRYLQHGANERAALAAPEQFAPYPAALDRLIVQAMDGRNLRYADNAFEAVITCRPIREAGGVDGIANLAYEVGRVLKPNGIASLTVEYTLSAPPGQMGWDPQRPLLSPSQIEHYVVEASGLELVEPWSLTPSAATLTLPRHLTLRPEEYEQAERRPYQLIYTVGGYVIGVLHLVLQKTERYPVRPNQWAKPTPQTIRRAGREAVAAARKLTQPAPEPVAPAVVSSAPPALGWLRQRLGEPVLMRLRAVYGGLLNVLPKSWAGALHKLAYRYGFVERL